MDEVRMGIVGFGLMGELYADALHDFPNSRVTALADTNPERRATAAQRYCCHVYETYEMMLQKDKLDAVIITLPDHLHRDAVIKSAEAGVDILVEKPFATSLADAQKMTESVEKNGVKCMVEYFNRWCMPFAKARDFVQQGKLGKIISASADLNDTIFVPTELLKWAANSSPAWFLMSHTADLMRWIIAEEPVSVFSKGTKKVLVSKGIDTYDCIESLVQYDGGTIARFTNCWILPICYPMVYELKMRLIGTEAAIDIDTSDQQMHLFTHNRYEHVINSWGKVLGNYVGYSFEMLRSFLSNIQDDTEPLITQQDGLANTRLIEAVHLSLESGKEIKLGV